MWGRTITLGNVFIYDRMSYHNNVLQHPQSVLKDIPIVLSLLHKDYNLRGIITFDPPSSPGAIGHYSVCLSL